MKSILYVFALIFALSAHAEPQTYLPGTGPDIGKTVVYRDTWGIAHIYAPTDEAGLYAQGYAMAEDRPEHLLINLLVAKGELASVIGEAGVLSDLRSRMWDHYDTARKGWPHLRPQLQSHLQAFVNGINGFYAEHPGDTPVWWQGRKVDPYMVIAFSRLFLYNWSIDEAYGDLIRGGIQPTFEPVERGSNQFAVSPSRTESGAAILAIDPHLNWHGPSRFWAFRIHAGKLHGSGVTLAGSPYIGLGHNADVAWAMTTGGPDTADVFVLQLNPEDPNSYRYDGEWKAMEKKSVQIAVAGEGQQEHTVWFSLHGPIIARHGDKAYAAASAYDGVFNVSETWYKLAYASDYKGAVDAMADLTLFPQNVMVADTSGNIYFQRTGRVPVRQSGYNWSLPVDGSMSVTRWTKMHPANELVQALNPAQGFMQNCNVPPDAMMPGSPFSLDGYPDYIYSSAEYGTHFSGWTTQRGARAIQLLQADDKVSIEDAIGIINDISPFGADRWINVLKMAAQKHGDTYKDNVKVQEALSEVFSWDLALANKSTAALKYFYWRQQMDQQFSADTLQRVKAGIDDWYASAAARAQQQVNYDELPLLEMLNAFAAGLANLENAHGTLTAVWGDRFRVGRGDRSWPVEGGGEHDTRTLRSMGYDQLRADGTQWGINGQTSTQIVSLSRPIESWGYLPLGESDRQDSPHFDDQAERLFSTRTLTSSWWMPAQLIDHIESRTVLGYQD